MNWHMQNIISVLNELGVDSAKGLSTDDVGRLRASHGRNELFDRGGESPWRILWRQCTSSMALLLTGAAILSGVVGSIHDSVTILAIVCFFTLLGFVQEYRAEKSLEILKKMSVPFVRVRREGVISKIPAVELVPGDIIFLESGNVVPADGRLLETYNLKVAESVLTGESEAVDKTADILPEENTSLGDRRNMIYMGTTISYGRCVSVITETGMATELGRISTMMQSVVTEWTPLQIRLDRLGKMLAVIAVVVSSIIFFFGLLRGEGVVLMLMTAVSLAVAAIPEGLPAVVTITLALGSQHMLRRNALIRRLQAVEALGSVTVICSDKTGTLTENHMTVTEMVPSSHLVFPENKKEDGDMRRISTCIALCNDAVLGKNGYVAAGDATEGALLVAAARQGVSRSELDPIFPRIAEIPFDSVAKYMATLHAIASKEGAAAFGFPSSHTLIAVKGAIDAVLTHCRYIDGVKGSVLLDEAKLRVIDEKANRLAALGQRVLAVAYGAIELPYPLTGTGIPPLEGKNCTLTFAGLIAMMDPPRKEAQAAVALCKRAGIRPVMITGDHPLTASAIAATVGIGDGTVLIGSDLDKFRAAELPAVMATVSVYARVSPEHKLLIVEELQRNGHIVAMTGDGVNDAPALKKANIGISMGKIGTDVAKEAADMVLLDDNFATIVAAVEEGRTIYDNILRFIEFSVAGNLGKIITMLTLPFLGLPMPLTPLQLLWLNLLTDGLLGLGMGVERSEPDVMRRPPVPPHSHIFDRRMMSHVVLTGCIIGLSTILLTTYFWHRQQEYWQTALFTSLAFAQIGQSLALRSFRHSFFRIGFFTNPMLLFMICGVIFLQSCVIYLPLLQTLFKTTYLSIGSFLMVLLPGITVFGVLELRKLLLQK